MKNGEGNGNPLQCSCLENPRDGGAWWVAVYGVAQSRTRLKRLSSSSSRDEERERIFYLNLCLNVILLLCLILTILIKTANLHSTLSILSWSISSIVLIAFWYTIYLTIFIVHCMCIVCTKADFFFFSLILVCFIHGCFQARRLVPGTNK